MEATRFEPHHLFTSTVISCHMCLMTVAPPECMKGRQHISNIYHDDLWGAFQALPAERSRAQFGKFVLLFFFYCYCCSRGLAKSCSHCSSSTSALLLISLMEIASVCPLTNAHVPSLLTNTPVQCSSAAPTDFLVKDLKILYYAQNGQ